jgi:hypothetical protein
MWLQSYTAPVIALLALCAAGVGFVEFHNKATPIGNEPGSSKSPLSAEQSAENSRKSSAPTPGVDILERRLASELERLQKSQESERKQYEELRRSLVTSVLTKEENLRRLEQRAAAERDRDTRAAAGLEDEQITLEKQYRALDPTGQFGKDHAEVRKLDLSLRQIRTVLAERAAQFQAREEKTSAELIELRLNIESAKQKLRYEDEHWNRRSASLDASIAQLRRSQELMTLHRELPEMNRQLRNEADDARASRIEEKLDQLSRAMIELRQQLGKP